MSYRDRRLRQAAEERDSNESDSSSDRSDFDRRLFEAAEEADSNDDDGGGRDVRPGRGTEDRVVEREPSPTPSPSPSPEPTPSPEPSPPSRAPRSGTQTTPSTEPDQEMADMNQEAQDFVSDVTDRVREETERAGEAISEGIETIQDAAGISDREMDSRDMQIDSERVSEFREEVRQENPRARDIEISEEDGQLEATFETPSRDPDPVAGAISGFAEDVSGVDLPTEPELLGGFERSLESATGVDIPTRRGFITGTQLAFESGTGVDLPTEREFTRGLRSGVTDLTDVTLPTDEQVGAAARGGFQDVTGVSDETIQAARDPASIIAAGAPIAAAEPTPFGEAALAGVAVGAGIVSEGQRLTSPTQVQTVREQPEVPVDQFGIPDEITIPTGEFGGGVSLPDGVTQDRPEIPVPSDGGVGMQDGEIQVPEDGTGGAFIQTGGTLISPEQEERMEPEEPEMDEEDIFRGPDPITGGERQPDVERDPFESPFDTPFESPFDIDDGRVEDIEDPTVTPGGFLQERLERLREDVQQQEVTQDAEDIDTFFDVGVGQGTDLDLPPFAGFDVDTTADEDITPEDIGTPTDFFTPEVFQPATPPTTITTTTTTEIVTETPVVPGQPPRVTQRRQPVATFGLGMEDEEEEEEPIGFEGFQAVDTQIRPLQDEPERASNVDQSKLEEDLDRYRRGGF